MVQISVVERRQAFAFWLRTGRLPRTHAADGTELKFNPYHDERNGQFTSGPGGGGTAAARPRSAGHGDKPKSSVLGDEGHLRSQASLTPVGSEPSPGRGSNSRAFEDPMTLEQAFPGLAGSPAGAILAPVDGLLDVTGPANRMVAGVLEDQSKQLIAEIKSIDPKWVDYRLGPIDSIEGLTNEVNDLRFQRAAAIARIKGDYGPLQVETLRFLQRQTDVAYDRGLELQQAGRLPARLNDREALGNYVDQQVRQELRERYYGLRIDSAGQGPVRVNRREYDTSGTDRTYRQPDARIKDVAFDVTLTRKTLSTAQIRGFFNSDFRPSRVVIIRPRRLGANNTYMISRPETKR